MFTFCRCIDNCSCKLGIVIAGAALPEEQLTGHLHKHTKSESLKVRPPSLHFERAPSQVKSYESEPQEEMQVMKTLGGKAEVTHQGQLTCEPTQGADPHVMKNSATKTRLSQNEEKYPPSHS